MGNGKYASRSTRGGLTTLFILAATGCGDGEGRFSVVFSWAVDVPPANTVAVEGEVTAPSGQRTASSPLRVPFSPGTSLSFDSIAFGNDLVVTARFRPIDEPEGPVLYFGRSAPFNFVAGQDVVVPVAVDLTNAPEVRAVQIQGERNERVASPQLVIDLEARGATRIDVAQSVLFDRGLRSTSVPATAEGDFASVRIEYDLNETLDACNPAVDGDPSTCEGPRQIFIRAVREDLASTSALETFTLDTVLPSPLRSSIEYAPADQNVLVAVNAATGAVGPGATTVFVTVTFDEPIDTRQFEPRLTASNGVDTIQFAPDTNLEAIVSAVAFEAIVDADQHGDGVYVPTVVVQDLAGNEASAVVNLAPPGLVVDHTPPPSIAVGLADAVVLHRRPWTTDTRPGARLELELSPSAVDATDVGTVIVRDAANAEVGRATLEAGGAVDGRIQLTGADAPTFSVVAVDRAGNESVPAFVRDGRWTATVGGADLSRNPNRFFTTVQARSALFQQDRAIGQVPTNEALRSLAETASPEPLTITGERLWTIVSAADAVDVTPSEAPSVFDRVRGAAVVVAGEGLPAVYEDLGFGWRLTPSAGVNPGASINAFFDERRGRMVFSGFRGDVFEWDGLQISQTERNFDTVGATLRNAAVYDRTRGRGYGVGDGIEVYDLTGPGDPQRIVPVGPRPPTDAFSISDFGAAMDATTDELLVVFDDPNAGAIRLWAFDLDARTWRQRASLTTSDTLQKRAVCFDRRRDRLVVVTSGISQDSIRQWRSDANTWSTPLVDAGASRTWRACHWDPVRGQVVLREFGSELPSDWDGQALTPRTPRAPAAGGERADLFFDPAIGRPVLIAPEKPSAFDLGGVAWSATGGASPSIPVRRDAFGPDGLRGTWDPVRQEFVVQAGGHTRGATARSRSRQTPPRP